MSKYTGNYWTSNGTRNALPLELGNNLREAKKACREIARGEIVSSGSASWEVKEESGEVVAKGIVR